MVGQGGGEVTLTARCRNENSRCRNSELRVCLFVSLACVQVSKHVDKEVCVQITYHIFKAIETCTFAFIHSLLQQNLYDCFIFTVKL